MERLKLYRSGQVVGELTVEPEGLDTLVSRPVCSVCGAGMFGPGRWESEARCPWGFWSRFMVSSSHPPTLVPAVSWLPLGKLVRGEVRRCGRGRGACLELGIRKRCLNSMYTKSAAGRGPGHGAPRQEKELPAMLASPYVGGSLSHDGDVLFARRGR